MFKMKKTLSVIIALVMVLSCVSVAAFAHTSTWAENPDTVNLKYEVEQVPSVTMSDGSGTYTAVDNDIYAVTVYAKTPALTGIMYLQVPFQYDVRYFEPIMTMDGGELYCAYDGWYTDITTTDVCYSLPAHFSDTNAYDQNGAVTTSSLKTKCYGLGHANAGTCSFGSYYYGPDDPATTNMKAYEGLDENMRVCAITLDDSSMTAKTAYLNSVEGKIPTDWVPMGTLYFHRVEGVSEAEAVGKTIGIADGANFGTQLTTRTTTAAQPAGYLTAHTNPKYEANYVSNAVVAGATEASFVQYSKAQIRFAGIGETSTAADYKGTFDVRTVAKISQADFIANFTDEATAKEKITDVGFVYATTDNVPTFDIEKAKTAAQTLANEESLDGYVKKAVSYMQHTGDGADYIFTCLIENIADADKDQTVNCLGYVCFDGTYYYFDAAAAVSFNTLYTAHFPKA